MTVRGAAPKPLPASSLPLSLVSKCRAAYLRYGSAIKKTPNINVLKVIEIIKKRKIILIIILIILIFV
jgi:hypothetical protein